MKKQQDHEELIHHEVMSDDEISIIQPSLEEKQRYRNFVQTSSPQEIVTEQPQQVAQLDMPPQQEQEPLPQTFRRVFQKTVVRVLEKITEQDSEDEQEKQKKQIVAIHGMEQYLKYDKKQKQKLQQQDEQKLYNSQNQFQRFQETQVKLAHEQRFKHPTGLEQWRAKKQQLQASQQQKINKSVFNHSQFYNGQPQYFQQRNNNAIMELMINQKAALYEQQLKSYQKSLNQKYPGQSMQIKQGPFLPSMRQEPQKQQLYPQSIYPYIQEMPSATRRLNQQQNDHMVPERQITPVLETPTNLQVDTLQQQTEDFQNQISQDTQKTIEELRDYQERLENMGEKDPQVDIKFDRLFNQVNEKLDVLVQGDPGVQVSEDVSKFQQHEALTQVSEQLVISQLQKDDDKSQTFEIQLNIDEEFEIDMGDFGDEQQILQDQSPKTDEQLLPSEQVVDKPPQKKAKFIGRTCQIINYD